VVAAPPPRNWEEYLTLAGHLEETNPPRPDRVDIDIPVHLRSRAGSGRGTVKNVCTGGIFVATHSLLPIGDWVVVTFMIPGAIEPVEILGEVRWSRPLQDLVDVPGGLGLRFVETSVRATVLALELQRMNGASS
jgi:Tfp pilus assembly protein PilZ